MSDLEKYFILSHDDWCRELDKVDDKSVMFEMILIHLSGIVDKLDKLRENG